MTPQYYNDALAEIGIREVAGPSSNPRVLEYQTAAGYNAKQDDVPWCASFMSWLMRKNNIKYRFATSAQAADWQYFGKALKTPVTGAVMVFPHHVTLFSSWVDDTKTVFWGLGGNQGGAAAGGGEVRLSKFKIDDVIAIRWPDEVPLPTAASKPVNNPTIKGAIAVGAAVVPVVAESSNEIVSGLGKAQSQLGTGTILGAVGGAVILIATAYIIVSAVQKRQLDKKFSNPAESAVDTRPDVPITPTT